MMSQVDKHLKTLIKYLKNVVETCRDPLIIEHTQKQIKNIHSIHAQLKNTINNKEKYGDGVRGLDEIFASALDQSLDAQSAR